MPSFIHSQVQLVSHYANAWRLLELLTEAHIVSESWLLGIRAT